MSDIQIQKHHNMDAEQLRALNKELGEKLTAKFGGEYQLEGDTVRYSYNGADTSVSFDETTVNVDVKLGFLMKAFKGMIESEVNNYLDELIT